MIVPQLPVSDLQGRLQILQEEVSALKECLCASGALSHDRFLARLHRERFDRICRAHPLELDGTATLTRAFALHELTVSVVSLAGVAAVRALRSASHAVGRAACRAKPAADLVAASSQGQIFVCGGYDGTRLLEDIHRFDPISHTWGSVPPMSLAREAAVAAVIGGQIVVCGGFDGQR